MLKSTKVGYIFIAVFIALAGAWVLPENIGNTSTVPAATNVLVTIGQTVLAVELATTTPAIQKGLSGRTSLGPQSGMLFVFPKPAIYRFWMPDMHFPLDIIWINNGKVVDISENVSNEFDLAHPRFYVPSQPAQYVLEVNAGFAASEHIRVGDAAVFNGI